MNFEDILYEVKDIVAVITLNRPDRMNAWTGTMAKELSLALQEADKDNNVRAVVITGAGRAFCAGFDLAKGEDAFRDQGDDDAEPKARKQVQPHQINKPVIGAINGHAVGIGLAYTMLCDIRIVAEDAKLGFVFVRRGIVGECASHLLLPRAVGFYTATELLLSGRIFLGQEAGDMGLVNQVLPKDQVLPRAMEIASEYRLGSPVSIAITKRLLWESLSTGIEDMREREFPFIRWIAKQPDAAEGAVSFLEKREPDWPMAIDKDMPDFL